MMNVCEGIDTANELSEALTTVHGFIDSVYVKKLAKKTHRGLEGKNLRGFQAGGRCYGYENVKTQSGVGLDVNPDEARIVLSIFAMYDAGLSLKLVTKALDARTGKTLHQSGKTMGSWTHFSGLAVNEGRV